MASVMNFRQVLHSRDDEEDDLDLQHRNKIRRNEMDYSDFKDGAIIRLRLTNFVTYALTEFHLSPYLNMIIGPNGSGKSTFVCAICLGLAGKPEYIGRAKRVEDYIKNGTEQSIIEITLKNSRLVNGFPMIKSTDDVITIKTVIMKSKKKCVYSINQQSASENQVKALVSVLNIQLDNLCQFLSQERVEEFARLKSNKLLEETIRSIDPSLVDMLEEVKNDQQEEINLSRDVEINKKKLEKLLVKKESLETQVRALEEYERKKNEIDVHKKLLPYARVKNHKRQLKDLKKIYELAKQELKEFLKDKRPYKVANEELIEASSEIEKIRKEKEEQYNALMKVQSNIIAKIQEHKNSVEDLKKKITYYRTRRENMQRKIEKAEEDIFNRNKLLETLSLPSQQDMDKYESMRVNLYEKESEIERKKEELDSTARALNRELTTVRSRSERLKRDLASNDNLNVLRGQTGRLDEVRRACEYIRQHPEMTGKVLEPPIVTISCPDAKIASYLTTCVDWHTSISLTMVDSATYKQFNDQILQSFQVNLRELASIEVPYPYPIDSIRSLGFEGYLCDFIKGDEAVIQMLKEQQKIHTIPVSTSDLDSRVIDELRRPDSQGQLKFRRVIAGDYVYDFKRSRYGDRQIFSTDVQVKKAQFYMGSGMSESLKQNVRQELLQLRERYQALQKEIAETTEFKKQYASPMAQIKEELRELQQQIHDMNHKRMLKSRTISEINSIKQKVDEYKRDMNKDVSAAIAGCEEQIGSLLRAQTDELKLMVKNMRDIQLVQQALAELGIKHIEARNRERTFNDIIGFFNERETQLREKAEEAKAAYAAVKDTAEFKGWMQQIRSYSDEVRSELSEWANRYEDNGQFTLSTILDIVSRLETEIQMTNHDDSVITILKQTLENINYLQVTLPKQVEKLNSIRIGIKSLASELEPKLDETVQKISQRFRALFSNVGSAGEVCLVKPNLYSEWKIEIKVKFRDVAELKQLDSHTQSGGERAVSTVLYMIALQDFTNAPFRVVDEINQGMDARNERIVHKAMVENACSGSTSQYFLITPKLLTRLQYHEKMRIHCVFAGSWIPDPSLDSERIHFGELTRYQL
ncbi:HBL071Wp [Eremothecium sinecaudum]|uniref:Structural maintenance of chromosomes protein 5 n=1 Tax=Eremothecium sinecaudum TaxID=45286 RepID=A0A125RDX3_9SACH|nr:HBL071Wp [Eremothecium sinecaudum]AMD18831.1 HBL071Wp [Eremothecium sinecaudum]